MIIGRRCIHTIGCFAAIFALGRAAGAQTLRYTCSWIANTYGGKSSEWVQDWVEGMYVSPNGTVYTNAYWDEGTREVGIYREGRVIGSAGHTHGWGLTGGSAITANSKYLYFAQSVNSEGGNLKDPNTWPAKGKVWFGISRRLLTDPEKAAPFLRGRGGKGDTLAGQFLLMNEFPEGEKAGIAGLAASATRLYASDAATQHVRVYDAETMAPVTTWRVESPGQLALAPDGTLWCLDYTGKQFCVMHFSSEGAQLPGKINLAAETAPTGLAVDAGGRVLITDDGPDQNVKVFLPGSANPTAVLGVRGGVFAGATPGATGPARFHDLAGIGVDGKGNIYVAGGYGASGDGVGTEIECYTPAAKREWQLLGLFFVDEAEADALHDTEVFGKHEHIVLDYSKRTPGSEWAYRAFTLNRFRYPDDPRIHLSPNTVWVREIAGKRFLYMTDMYSSFLAIYRFAGSSEVAIPCGFFAKGPQKDARGGAWPRGQPETGEWIWIDANGDGKFDQAEIDGLRPAKDAPPLWGWWVDDKGDVWQATEHDGIRHFPIRGLNAWGCPVYRHADMQTTAVPELFNSLQRAQYDRASDSMYLSGYTNSYPNDHGYWKVVGRVIACVDRWGAGNRAPKWVQTVSAPDAQHAAQVTMPASFTTAGDYLFTVGVMDARIDVYSRLTGEHKGSMTPGPEVGGKSGWVDVPYGISAHRRADGEYIILVEEDAFAKNIMYRWKP